MDVLNTKWSLQHDPLPSSHPPYQNQVATFPLPNHIITQFPSPDLARKHRRPIQRGPPHDESARIASLHLVTYNPNNPTWWNQQQFSLNNASSSGSEGPQPSTHPILRSKRCLASPNPAPDLFVVVGGNVTTGNGNRSPFFAWTADFRRHDISKEKTTNPEIETITQLSKTLLPNGLTSTRNNPNPVLIADSFAGLIWRLDILSGDYEVADKVPEMAAPTNSSGPVGVNGIKVHRNTNPWC
ncbi:hypothetical protein QBC32DRAFT_132987 [Pseudoneurospora amorphoporcata]|uniref:Uncharacterized protein n=1 Tax=Pseudoneurospora amorphoporcata TaxID=241081 RepID=A0AAN6NZQ7_9PEZI|nr:hypothetical protein QBC32DRAFT_132987 [Pseudoneurospora amorphoporcata]